MKPQDLLDRLAAGYDYDPMYGALCNERDQLQAENAKLRDLLKSYWKRTHSIAGPNVERNYLREMRELGIEVDG